MFQEMIFMVQTAPGRFDQQEAPVPAVDLQGRGLGFDAAVGWPDQGVTVKVTSSVVISPPSWARQRST